MNGLIEYKDDDINGFFIERDSIEAKLSQYNISLSKQEFFNLRYFVDQKFYSHGYREHNIYRNSIAYTKNDAHEHGTEEARMILRGTGRFYFLINNVRLELDVYPGDFIVIPAGMTHYFNHIESVLVLRFIDKEDLYDV